MTAEEYQTEAERITPQLRQTALRYMGDASLSEDIAQDVLLRLWQLLDELRTPMDGLALTMVRNECLMRLRKQPRTVGMEGHDMAEQPSVNPMAELTLSMLDKLPPLQQTILRLRHIDGRDRHLAPQGGGGRQTKPKPREKDAPAMDHQKNEGGRDMMKEEEEIRRKEEER